MRHVSSSDKAIEKYHLFTSLPNSICYMCCFICKWYYFFKFIKNKLWHWSECLMQSQSLSLLIGGLVNLLHLRFLIGRLCVQPSTNQQRCIFQILHSEHVPNRIVRGKKIGRARAAYCWKEFKDQDWGRPCCQPLPRGVRRPRPRAGPSWS